MISLKDFIENVSIPLPVLFKYKDEEYEASIPIIDDFTDDNKDYLLNKNVISVDSITDENCSCGIRLIIVLKDWFSLILQKDKGRY